MYLFETTNKSRWLLVGFFTIEEKNGLSESNRIQSARKVINEQRNHVDNIRHLILFYANDGIVDGSQREQRKVAGEEGHSNDTHKNTTYGKDSKVRYSLLLFLSQED